jgi:hypothetical protein
VAVYFVTKDDSTESAAPATTASTSTGAVTGATPAGLAGIVPNEVFKDCEVQATPNSGAVETAVCLPPARRTQPFYPDRLELSTFANLADLKAAYEAERSSHDIAQDSGRCDGSQWGGAGAWLHGPGKPGGHRLCYFEGNVAVIVWTHEKLGQASHLDMLGKARIGGSDHAGLFNWWRFWHHRIGKCPQPDCEASLT